MREWHEYLIPDPEFSQYVFHVMCGASVEKIRQLEPAYVEHFKNTDTKKKFCERASLEEKLRLLAMLNISYCIVVAEEDNDVMPVIAEMSTYSQVDRKKLTLTDVMVRDKMFAISSREVLIGAHLAASQAHSKVYQLNQHHFNNYKDLKEASVRIAGGEHQEARVAFDKMAGFVLALSTALDDIPTMGDLWPLETKMLLILYRTRHSYISTDELASRAGNGMTTKNAGKMATRLEARGLVSSLRFRPTQSQRVNKFLIMEAGISMVHDWIKFLCRRAESGE